MPFVLKINTEHPIFQNANIEREVGNLLSRIGARLMGAATIPPRVGSDIRTRTGVTIGHWTYTREKAPTDALHGA
jgi:hypothetical protein